MKLYIAGKSKKQATVKATLRCAVLGLGALLGGAAWKAATTASRACEVVQAWEDKGLHATNVWQVRGMLARQRWLGSLRPSPPLDPLEACGLVPGEASACWWRLLLQPRQAGRLLACLEERVLEAQHDHEAFGARLCCGVILALVVTMGLMAARRLVRGRVKGVTGQQESPNIDCFVDAPEADACEVLEEDWATPAADSDAMEETWTTATAVVEECTEEECWATPPEYVEELMVKSSFKQEDVSQTPVKKTIRFNFQILSNFIQIRELYCDYDYCKYGFPLSSIPSELQTLKEKSVMPQEAPPKETVNRLPEPKETVPEKTTDRDNKNTEPQRLTGILKKGKTASTGHKCLHFNFQNLNTFAKDRELYCGYDYFRYGTPLSSILELQKLKERTVRPQKGPIQDAVNKHNTLHQQTVRAAGCAPMNTTIGGKSPKGILKQEKLPRSTCPKHVRFNLGNLRAPVKERELYRGHDYFRYAAPLQVTQPPNFTSWDRHQPVRPASNSLPGAPRHLGRPAQRSYDYFQQNSGRNAAHNYTNSRHSQHRQHNSSSQVSPRHETRHFFGGQTHPGTNSHSRSRVKRGAKPGDGDVVGEQGEYTAS